MLKRFFLGNPANHTQYVLNAILLLVSLIAVVSLGILAMMFAVFAEITPDYEGPPRGFFLVLISAMVFCIVMPFTLLIIGHVKTFKSEWRYMKTGQEA